MAASSLLRSSSAFLRSSFPGQSTSTALHFASLRSLSRSSLLGAPLPPSSAARSTARFDFLRRESVGLTSMLPFHSVVASARLVSRLPYEADAVLEGKYANYVSPI